MHFKILRNFWVFVNMGPYGSQNFKTLLLPQIAFESFQTFFLNFRLSSRHKSTVLDFWKLEFVILYDFFRFHQHGTLWEPKLQNVTPASNHFWILANFFWIFFSVVLTKALFGIFEIFSLWFLVNFFPLTRYSSLKSLLIFSKLFLNVLLSIPHKSTVVDFWNFEFTIFIIFSPNLKFSIVPYGKTER